MAAEEAVAGIVAEPLPSVPWAVSRPEFLDLLKGWRGVMGERKVLALRGPVLGVPFARARALERALTCFLPAL